MRRLGIGVFVLVLVGLASACGGGGDSNDGNGKFTFLGFSDHTGPNNSAPTDVVKSGGKLIGCNPASLYAFVGFRDLTPPKQFAGHWTLDDAPLNQQEFNQTQASAQTFWQVQNTPRPLSAGTYRFQLSVDGKVVSKANFKMTC